MACEDPDNPANWPRNLFVWRSNLLGSSGKGHEYFLKHLLGTTHGVQGKDLGETAEEAGRSRLARQGAGRQARPAGHARLPHVDDLRLLRHRAADRDLVREERPQHLRHAPLHPSAVRGGGPGVGMRAATGRSTRAIAQEVLRSRAGHLGVEKDVVLTPIMHDTPGELAQPFDVKDWKKGEIDPIPGKTMPAVTVVERDYPERLQALHRARSADGASSAMAARASAGTPSMRSNCSSGSMATSTEEGADQGACPRSTRISMPAKSS